jgi:uncharacterized membrane protein YcaP (DUF421 family)
MDLLGALVRAAAAYGILLVLIRASRKRTVRHGNLLDFTVALVLGDLVDDMIFGEVAWGQFVVAAAVVFGAHVMLDSVRARSGLAR